VVVVVVSMMLCVGTLMVGGCAFYYRRQIWNMFVGHIGEHVVHYHRRRRGPRHGSVAALAGDGRRRSVATVDLPSEVRTLEDEDFLSDGSEEMGAEEEVQIY